jgi:sugar phosphate isomerase/epimerase
MANQLSFGVVAAALSNDARDAAATARNAGFNGLQFDAVTASLDLTALSITGRREFRHMLAQQDQVLCGLTASAGSVLPGGDLDKLLWRLDRILETAAGLAAPMLCLDLGILPRPDDTTFTTQTSAVMVELGRMADRYGIVLAMRSDLSGLESVRRVIEEANCPWFGIDLDPVAVLQDGGTAEAAMTKFARLLRHVRGRDALVGLDHRSRSTPIGKGNVDWPRFFIALDAAQFGGWITLDTIALTERAAGAVAGLNYLKSLLRPI